MVTRSLIALAALLAFVALGEFVARVPPGKFDTRGVKLLGGATPVALFFTRSGYGGGLLAAGVLGVLAAFFQRVSVVTPAVLIVVQFLSQGAVQGVKMLYRRSRPGEWIHKAELGHSYPSGHAVSAIVFYVGWATIVWGWPLPKTMRLMIVGVLAVWAMGIGWSRMALGAHYATDVIGGYLFGTAWFFVFLLLLSLVARNFR